MSRLVSNIILLIWFSVICHAQDGWRKKNLTEREMVNLSVVSDMYGYARHFYPKPQNDKMDWTKFLMYAIEKTEAAENDDALLEILDELFQPLIPDALFKKDTLPVISRRTKESGKFYVRSHYHPTAGRFPRMRDYKKSAGNGVIQHVKDYEKHIPVPDSMYRYQLKDDLYVFFPIAVSELPAKNKQYKQLIKETDKIDLRLMPGNMLVNVLFRKEKLRSLKYNIPNYQNVSFRLAKIVMLHHQIRHFYPYYFEDGLDETWDAVSANALNDVAASDNQFDYFDVTRRLMANVKDSHIFVNFTFCQGGVCLQIPWLWPEVEFTFFGDSLYVQNVGGSLTDKLVRWDRVISVNEEPFEKWLASRLAMTSASTYQSALKKLSRDIFSTVEDSLTIRLTLENLSGEIKNAEVPVNINNSFKIQEYPYIAKEIEDRIWHVNLCYPAREYKKFAEYIPQLKNAKGIIFDVRGYPQYYTLSVLAHLIDSVISAGHLRGSDYFFPNQHHSVYWKKEPDWYVASATASYSAEYAKKYEYEKPLEVRFTCPVVFLTDANALSYGETFMQMVKNYQIGTIIGEPTAGTNGDVRFDFELMMTGFKFTNHDDSRFHGIGVIPDIFVRREVGEIDNVLEYAKSYIRVKNLF